MNEAYRVRRARALRLLGLLLILELLVVGGVGAIVGVVTRSLPWALIGGIGAAFGLAGVGSVAQAVLLRHIERRGTSTAGGAPVNPLRRSVVQAARLDVFGWVGVLMVLIGMVAGLQLRVINPGVADSVTGAGAIAVAVSGVRMRRRLRRLRALRKQVAPGGVTPPPEAVG